MTVDPRDLIPALGDRRESDATGSNREWSEASPLPVEGDDAAEKPTDAGGQQRRDHDQNP